MVHLIFENEGWKIKIDFLGNSREYLTTAAGFLENGIRKLISFGKFGKCGKCKY